MDRWEAELLTSIPSSSIPCSNEYRVTSTNVATTTFLSKTTYALNVSQVDNILLAYPVATNVTADSSSGDTSGTLAPATSTSPQAQSQTRSMYISTNTALPPRKQSSSPVAVIAGSFTGGIVLLAIVLTILLVKRRKRLRRQESASDRESSVPSISVTNRPIARGVPLRTRSRNGNTNHNGNGDGDGDNQHQFPPSSHRQLQRQQGQLRHSRSNSHSHRLPSSSSSKRTRGTSVRTDGRSKNTGDTSSGIVHDEIYDPGSPSSAPPSTGTSGARPSGRSISGSTSSTHAMKALAGPKSSGSRRTSRSAGSPLGSRIAEEEGGSNDTQELTEASTPSVSTSPSTSPPTPSPLAPSALPPPLTKKFNGSNSTISDSKSTLGLYAIGSLSPPTHRLSSSSPTTHSTPTSPQSSHSASVPLVLRDANGAASGFSHDVQRGPMPSSSSLPRGLPRGGHGRDRESNSRVSSPLRIDVTLPRVSMPPSVYGRSIHESGHDRHTNGNWSQSGSGGGSTSEQTLAELQTQIEALRRENEALRSRSGSSRASSPGRSPIAQDALQMSMSMSLPQDAPPAYDPGPGHSGRII